MKLLMTPKLPVADLSPELVASYDRIVLAFSGGKDSLACFLLLLEMGVPREKIELHHHLVDGGGRQFMDWPITEAYCQAVADHFEVALYISYKIGGFEREMLRNGDRTAPIRWRGPDGTWYEQGGNAGKFGVRFKFPQVSPDLRIRWCSPYLKIDVLSALIRNSPRFDVGTTLVITGERAQESAGRAKYAQFEKDRTDNRHGKRAPRYVDHWRPVHRWNEAEVWAIIKRWGIIPHPAYALSWGRLSCRQCIFGSRNQWATIKAIYPEAFDAVAAREDQFGVTIRRDGSIHDAAARGTPYQAALDQPDLAEFANQTEWTGPIVTDDWIMPAGAFGESAGPS